MPNKPKTHAQRMKEARAPMSDDRPSAARRGYGHSWRVLRAYKLTRNPLCEHDGCGEVATDVDHIQALSRGGTNHMSNLRALCHRHHSQKTVREDGGFGRTKLK